ncbi:MAG: alpha/beta hydrolase [Kiritimatiellales bacterium]|nr:alpha/beta hydrolase [Kiritimatiellales bacterium]
MCCVAFIVGVNANGDTKKILYKETGKHRLHFFARFPDGHRKSDQRAAIVFFRGGGYQQGKGDSFQWHARYFSKRGLVALSAEFRGVKSHNGTAITAMQDSVSAIRWIRKNADTLGIDPNRIIFSGGSAGGHLALVPAMLDIEDPTDDASIGKMPNALVLFNPGITRTIKDREYFEVKCRIDVSMKEKMCPMLHIGQGLPPAVIFHGTEDAVIPYSTVEEFIARYKSKGNVAVLQGYPGKSHGFYHIKKPDIFKDTCLKADRFLQQQGLIEGKENPKIADEIIAAWKQDGGGKRK